MTSKPALVPSKNVLRLLRRLALSNPTVVVGAVGSACGVAALNHETRRRVHLAEKIVHTKRVIQSVSNGRSASHIAHMFQQAERGEDFTLDPAKSSKRRRKRNYSALAVERTPAEEDDICRINEPSVPENTYFENSDRSQLLHDENDFSTNRKQAPQPRIQNEVSKASSSVEENPRLKSVLLTDNLRQRTSVYESELLKHKSEHVNGDGTAAHVTTKGSDLLQTMKPNNNATRTLAGLSDEEQQYWDGNALRSDPVIGSGLPSSEMHQPQSASVQPSDSLALSTPEQDHGDRETRRTPSQSAENIAIINGEFQNWIPFPKIGDIEDEQRLTENNKEVLEPDQPLGSTLNGPVVRNESNLSSILENATQDASYLLHREEFILKENSSQLSRQIVVEFERCWQHIRRLRRKEKLRNKPYGNLSSNSIPSTPEEQFVGQTQWASDALEPLSHFDVKEKKDIAQQLCVTYKHISRAIIQRTPQLKDAIRPLIHYLCFAGESKIAEELANALANAHEFRTMRFVYDLLVYAYALEDDWAGVRHIMSELHINGVSRGEAFNFSLLFNSIFEIYISRKPIDQAYSYLFYAIDNWGLVPSNTVSMSIISAAIKEKRYDLVQHWVHAVRQSFPDRGSGTFSMACAWAVGSAWQELAASCEDIEQGCHAMAFAAFGDCFSTHFRDIVHEAITADLRRHLTEAHVCIYGNQIQSDTTLIEKMDLDNLFRYSQKLIAGRALNKTAKMREQDILTRLLHQIAAITRLNNIFAENRMEERRASFPQLRDQNHFTRRQTEKQSTRSKPELPSKLEGRLPVKIKDLIEIVSDRYEFAEQTGLPISHDILKEVVRKLRIDHRENDANILLNTIYNSSFTQSKTGTPFDTDLFCTWLISVYRLRQGRNIRKVLWAALDSSRSIEVSALFMVLTNWSFAREIRKGDKYNEPLQEEDENEHKYLQRRFEQIREARTSIVKTPSKVLPYKSWTDRMREFRPIAV